jgi:hypothetical protein
MAIDSIKLDAGDTEYFDVGMGKITKRLDKLSAEKAAAAKAAAVEKAAADKAAAERAAAAKAAAAKAAAVKKAAAEKAAKIAAGKAAVKRWDFFLSHTQRNGDAKSIALELFFGFSEQGKKIWLDVKMPEMDMEDAVNGSRCVLGLSFP